jgi:uncharacterized protein involved in exopolysaccharide biosynthesis
MDIRFFISRFMRRAHWFFLVLVLFSAAGIVLARALPSVYVASALLVVESEQIPDAMAQSTVQTLAGEQLEIIEQRILARGKLLDIANRLKVYETIRSGADRPLAAGEIVADMRDRIQINIASQAGQRGVGQATLVQVSFDAPTADMSAAVANELVTLILQEDVSMRTIVARQTLEFFQQEVERLEQALAAQSAAILQFKEQNLSALPDSMDFRREELNRIEAMVADLDRRRTAILDQIARIARLRGDVSSETAAALDGAPAPDTQVTTRDIRREDLNSELTLIENEKTGLEARILELQTSISKTPANAVLLEALERDYANVRAQYDLAVANRAKAETGETIEALSKGQRITVIEQAVAPERPEKPNRLLIAGGGVGAGLVAGIGLLVLLEYLRGAVRRPSDIVTALGITPLATLPYVATPGERRRQVLTLFAILAAFVGLVALGLWLLHTRVMPLDLIVDKLRARLPLWLAL